MDLRLSRGGDNRNRFSRLGTWYALALGIIAAVAIAGQVLIQLHLRDQASDSSVVNIAGKQRMLSQEISKIALLLGSDAGLYNRKELFAELRRSFSLWVKSHHALQHGDDTLHIQPNEDEQLAELFSKVNVAFEPMQRAAAAIIRQMEQDLNTPANSMQPSINVLHENHKQRNP